MTVLTSVSIVATYVAIAEITGVIVSWAVTCVTGAKPLASAVVVTTGCPCSAFAPSALAVFAMTLRSNSTFARLLALPKVSHLVSATPGLAFLTASPEVSLATVPSWFFLAGIA